MSYDDLEKDVLSFSRSMDEARRNTVMRPAPQIHVELIELKGAEAKAFDRGEVSLKTVVKTHNSDAQGV